MRLGSFTLAAVIALSINTANAEELVIRCEGVLYGKNPITREVHFSIDTKRKKIDDPRARPGTNIEDARQKTVEFTDKFIAHEIVWKWRNSGGELKQRFEINRVSGDFRWTETFSDGISYKMIGSCARSAKAF